MRNSGTNWRRNGLVIVAMSCMLLAIAGVDGHYRIEPYGEVVEEPQLRL